MGLDRRKMIMIFVGAWLSAALLTWFVFSRIAGAETEVTIPVIAAARDLPAGTRLKNSDMKRVNVPRKHAPSAAALDEKVVLDRVLMHPLNAGETIVTTKITTLSGADGIASTILPGMRAISVPIKDETSAGGLIQPRSRVDVLFTRTGSMREALTSTILQDVVVISVGRLTEAGQQTDTSGRTQPTVSSQTTRAATLMVTPEQAAKVELAKNQGKISLVLRNPLDKGTVENTSATAEALDPDIFAGAARALKSSVRAGIPNVRDDKVWEQLTGTEARTGVDGSPGFLKREPPKPRFVVDVYQGDKHVQEIFQ
jgi:pilus assembly protein CpaB